MVKKSKIRKEVEPKRKVQQHKTMDGHEKEKDEERQEPVELASHLHQLENLLMSSHVRHIQCVAPVPLTQKELKAQHQQEMQEIRNCFNSQMSEFCKEKGRLKQLHKAEVESLTEQVKALRHHKNFLVEEFETKLSKAHAYYECEFEAVKGTQQLVTECKVAEREEELQAQQAELQKTLTQVRTELVRVKGEACKYREKFYRLQLQLGTERNQHREKVQMEKEKEALQKNQAQIKRQKLLMQSLERTLCEEKSCHDKNMNDMKMRFKEEINQLKQSQAQTLEGVTREHQETLEISLHKAMRDQEEQLAELEWKFRSERFSLEEEKSLLRHQLDELTSKLTAATEQVLRLQEDNGAAEGQNARLKEAHDKLLEELISTRAELELNTFSKKCLEKQLSITQSSLQQLQHQFNQERVHLRLQVAELQTENQRYQQHLQEMENSTLKELELSEVTVQAQGGQKGTRELQELEQRLRRHHLAELLMVRDAHLQSIETCKQQSEQELETMRFEMEDEGKAKLASLQSELTNIQKTVIETLTESHQQESVAAQVELDKTVEQSRLQERELLGRTAELQEEMSRSRNYIAQLHYRNQTLSKKLELRDRQLLHITAASQETFKGHDRETSESSEKEKLYSTSAKPRKNLSTKSPAGSFCKEGKGLPKGRRIQKANMPCTLLVKGRNLTSKNPLLHQS